MRANRPRQRGITVVEAAIAMAIAAIAASAVVPGLGSVVEKQRLEGVASQLASDLQQARAQAVLRNTGLRLSIHAAPWGSCYVVHSGAVGQCECEASGPAVCSGSAQPLKTVRLALAGSSISGFFDAQPARQAANSTHSAPEESAVLRPERGNSIRIGEVSVD